MALLTLSKLPLHSTIPAKTPTVKFLIVRTPSLTLRTPESDHSTQSLSSSIPTLRANPPQKDVYPDPIPAFADAETQKFKIELKKTLSKDEDEFGDQLGEVINVCAKVLHEFLSNEYGGPGTLLVEPFTYMLIAIKEQNLPGAALAACKSLLWAQHHIDRDWQAWNSPS